MISPDRLGYCCINQTLRNATPNVFCSRSLIKRTFTIKSASERALANCKDLLTILQWNETQNIRCFRISSDLFPRFTCSDHAYQFEQLPHANQIRYVLKQVGDYAFQHNHILSFHPGPFTTIASPTESSAHNGIRELLYHNLMCDLIDPDNKLQLDINIHVGGSYGGDFTGTAQRFVTSFNSLPKSLQQRLCIENDDKINGWSVWHIHHYLYHHIGIPICFDTHHWKFCNRGSLEQEFSLAQSTWNRIMQVHHSESRNTEKDVTAHSDYYSLPIPDSIMYDNVYIHLESKQKELALLDYRKQFCQKGELCLQ